MTKIRKNDRYDTDRHELLLIRAGQHLVLDSRKNGLTVRERELLWEAAAIIWEAKRLYRIELAEKRRLKGQAFAEKMKSRRAHSGFRAGK